jgi:hypothetical protein
VFQFLLLWFFFSSLPFMILWSSIYRPNWCIGLTGQTPSVDKRVFCGN